MVFRKPFPVESTSVETARCARMIRVQQRHRVSGQAIRVASVFACRFTAGTTLYTAHAEGDAADFMLAGGHTPQELQRVADQVVRDGTKRTVRNRFRRTEVVFVSVGDQQWVRGQGWSHYDRVAHTSHVHAGCSFSTRTKPRCAGGDGKLPTRYVNGG